MRKLLCLLLTAALLSAALGAWAENIASPVDTLEKRVERVTVNVERSLDHLTVANPTQMKGHFFTNLWDNDTSDIDVRTLLEGYNLIEFHGDDGQFKADPTVVSGVLVTENGQGDRSYMLALNNDLYYSDGSPITAWDYAFAFLFSIDSRNNDLGGVADSRDYLLGCREYILRTAELKGTRLIRQDGLTVEQVETVRVSADETLTFAEVLGDQTEMTLARDLDNEVTLLPEDQEVADELLVHVDAQGIIQDWHYEDGVRVFADGSHMALPGVRVTSDHTLIVTVDHTYLPFFYEMGMLYCAPYPIAKIAPGVEVRDDGQGAYLANAKEQPEPLENPDAPVFCVENLKASLLDTEDGYLYLPSVSSGPYRMLSFDGTTAEFELNPYYKGNSRGQVPTIPSITFTLADNEDMVEKLATGEYDLLNKVTKASTLNEALALVQSGSYVITEENDARILETEYVSPNGYHFTNYPRIGLSFIAFCCEQESVSSQAVRQAIAWCMDRDLLAREYTGGYGLRVDGFYGLGQWMFGIVQGTMAPPVEQPADANNAGAWKAYEDEMAQWESLSLEGLTEYGLNLDRAHRLLDQDGWVLNDEGIREKDGVVLDLRMICPEGNRMMESFEKHLIPNLAQVGIRLTLVATPMDKLLSVYYGLPGFVSGESGLPELMDEKGERYIDMIYMASNLEVVFDPSIHFSVKEGTHNWMGTNYSDPRLYELAYELSHTEPGNVLEYMRHWVAFQECFNETLPMLPIYSNVYFDFSIGELQDYDVDKAITWGHAIIGATLQDAAAETGAALEEAGDGEFEIIE